MDRVEVEGEISFLNGSQAEMNSVKVLEGNRLGTPRKLCPSDNFAA